MKRKFEDTLDNTIIINKFAKLSVTMQEINEQITNTNINNTNRNDTNTNLDDISILYIIENGMASRQLIHQMYNYYINYTNTNTNTTTNTNTNTNTNTKYNKNYINEFIEMYNIYKLSKKNDKEVELELYKKIYKIHQI
jgi:hypothetical protein